MDVVAINITFVSFSSCVRSRVTKSLRVGFLARRRTRGRMRRVGRRVGRRGTRRVRRSGRLRGGGIRLSGKKTNRKKRGKGSTIPAGDSMDPSDGRTDTNRVKAIGRSSINDGVKDKLIKTRNSKVKCTSANDKRKLDSHRNAKNARISINNNNAFDCSKC